MFKYNPMQAQEALLRWVKSPDRLQLSRALHDLKEMVNAEGSGQRLAPIVSTVMLHSGRVDLVLRDLHDAISAAVYDEFQSALEDAPFSNDTLSPALAFPPPPPSPPPPLSASIPSADVPPPVEAFVSTHSENATQDEESNHDSFAREDEDGWRWEEDDNHGDDDASTTVSDDDGPPPLSNFELASLISFAWTENQTTFQGIVEVPSTEDEDEEREQEDEDEEEEEGEEGEQEEAEEEEEEGDEDGNCNHDHSVDGATNEGSGGDAAVDGAQCCAICHDAFREQQPVRMLRCNHIFHAPCVDRWLTQQRSTCPLCRMDQRSTYMV